ncbi:MAG: hypothetical protein WCR72_18555, partial [Bacteroidota bacterium]
MMNYTKDKKGRVELSRKKIFLFFLLFVCLILGNNVLLAQPDYSISHNDSLALENVIVEKYYISDSTDYIDTMADKLPIGAVTYRIFIDMKPGYSLQTVYGVPKHELFLKTTTTFFNNQECYAETGFNIDAKKLHTGTIALDSWITMGAASHVHTGILRSEDKDGVSLITNRPFFEQSDGLTKGILPDFRIFNLDLNFFRNNNTDNTFSTKEGAWAAL